MKTEDYFNEGTPFQNMKPSLSKGAVIGSVCDCVIPKPKDPYHYIDKKICRDCNETIEQTDL
jgi:hypothetical protein